MNLSIPYGRTYGLLGPNGAGKTTTVRMLNAIINKTSGRAVVGGYDITLQSNDIKRICGFLPETPGLYSKLTAREFLEFIGELYSMPRETLDARINELLDLFDLIGREHDLLEGYSRGMKQKVCLCAALIQDPEIIFLDEPTSNLDPAVARIVKDLIAVLVNKADKTIFICTHLLDVAEELCDTIGILVNGELKIEGSPREIVEKVGAINLEDAYLKVTGANHVNDLLGWRDASNQEIKSKSDRKKRKKK